MMSTSPIEISRDKILGPNQPWTQDSARVTAHALDVLDRSEEAAELRQRYGLKAPEKPKP
jgi:hypothetical protein